jgi:hypothetical protein
LIENLDFLSRLGRIVDGDLDAARGIRDVNEGSCLATGAYSSGYKILLLCSSSTAMTLF